MSFDYDLLVIGTGPGGYVAAIRASQLGMKVACIEKRSTLGGTCLNVGCIPSKALLESSEYYYQAKNKFKHHGINLPNISLDFPKMMERKGKVVTETINGINYLFKKNKIKLFSGVASFKDTQTVTVTGEKEKVCIKAKNIMIATGSSVVSLPFLPFDGKCVISSTEALSLKKVPKHLLLIGGGVIGVEIGSIYARLGCKVSIIEFLDRLIFPMDKGLAKTLEKTLSEMGNIDYHFQTKVISGEVKNNQVSIIGEEKNGKKLVLKGDCVLVCIGRKPCTDQLNLESIGVKLDKRGRIVTDDCFKTSVNHIFAIGDVREGVMLAHKASEEGVVCVENMLGQKSKLNYHSLPSVVYTWPEVASVGKSEEELTDLKIAYKVGKYPFKANAKARASDDTKGFVKILASKETDEILGVHIIGPRASDLIGEAVMAMEYRSSAEDIAMAFHAHPTYLEAIKEAALMASEGRPIHL